MADLRILSSLIVPNDDTREVSFLLQFSRPPDFFTLDSAGRQADTFQYFIDVHNITDFNTPEQGDTLLRGGEIHIRGDLRVRSVRGASDPDSGGWGPVRGSVPYTLRGAVMMFRVSYALLGDPDGRFTYTLSVGESGGRGDRVRGASPHEGCEPATNRTPDCTGNGIPDSCEPDCNKNGLADSCDLADGTSSDENGNGIPDECERIIFVKADAVGANNGTSWFDAYTDLQDAITRASASRGIVTEIWVAAGVYVPSLPTDPGDPRTATFALVSLANDFDRASNRYVPAVPLYGGFAGTETERSQRDPAVHRSILSGDRNGDDPVVADPAALATEPARADNCYHVVTHGLLAFAILDGFTITGGQADGDSPHDCGGGLYVDRVGPKRLRDCTFVGNYAEQDGGAIVGVRDLTGCIVRGNAAGRDGGGIRTGQAFDGFEISDTLFIGNLAGRYGGGVSIPTDARATLSDCLFIGNTAIQSGGGVASTGRTEGAFDCAVADGGGGTPKCHVQVRTSTLMNCRFHDNAAGRYGGGAFYEFSSLTRLIATQCIFTANEAVTASGGATYNVQNLVFCTVYANRAQTAGGVAVAAGTLTNCILWGNHDADGMSAEAQILGSGDIRYSCIQNWPDPGRDGNIADPPLFMNPAGPDGTIGTADDDLRLRTHSPCIDAGDNTVGLITDFAGNPRRIDDPATPDTGHPPGTNPMADMGAYESRGDDCNRNGIADDEDLFEGTSQDCNANAVPDECDLTDPVFVPGSDTPLSASLSTVVAADFDGDGNVDLAVTVQNPSRVCVLTNTAARGFAKASVWDVPAGAFALAAADVDRNGTMDLIVGGVPRSADGKEVSILFGDGEGRFSAGSTVRVSARAGSVIVEDLNGEGGPDLIIPDSPSGVVVVFPNDEGGHYGNSIEIELGANPEVVATADFNGDGRLDLVASTGANETIAVAINRGNWLFTPAIEFVVGGGYLRALVATDLDGDGSPDVAVAISSGSVAILLNDGTGSFARAGAIFLGASITGLVAGDFDGDGDMDLAASIGHTPDESGVSLLRNRGDATFAAAVTMPVGPQPRSIVAEDLDGNGSTDLAVVLGGFVGSVSTLLNVAFHSLDANGNGVPDECGPGDRDGDGDVDLADLVGFQACFTGPAQPSGPSCRFWDFDGDGDVDLTDFVAFQAFFTGAR